MRGACRLIVFLAWAVFCCLRLTWTLSLTPKALHARLRGLHTQKWSLGTARILGIRLRQIGLPPAAPCLVVSNHLGYLDILALSTAFPATFVSKAEVREWPLLGMMARMNGTLFLDRNRPRDAHRVNQRMQELQMQGAVIALFPEGTSSDGRRVLPFKPGLLDAAARGLWPVYAAHLRYRAPGIRAESGLCWHGDMEFLPHFWALLKRPGFVAEIALSPQPLRSGDRRRLAETSHQQVLSLRPGNAKPEWESGLPTTLSA